MFLMKIILIHTRGEKCRSNITQQKFLDKYEEFNNPLISVSDLHTGYDYDPKIINNVYRFEGKDHWFCKNCAMKGDKWFMMKHPCNDNNNNK